MNRPMAAVLIAALVCLTVVVVVMLLTRAITRDDVVRAASYVATFVVAKLTPDLIHWYREKSLDEEGSDPPPPNDGKECKHADSRD